MNDQVVVNGISKSFPGVQALKSVSMEFRSGEVHALCGENGAGKSTLMKILAGNMIPDEGQVLCFGHEYRPESPKSAREQGVILVHQELSLVPDMTVAENLFLGRLPTTMFGLVGKKRLETRALDVLATNGLAIKPSTKVRALSVAQQQMVEIARASTFHYRVAIFDEPTSALTDKESEQVYDVVKRLKEDGVVVIYITHKMGEVFSLADKITVLRDGEARGTFLTEGTNQQDIMNLMIGRELDNGIVEKPCERKSELLRLSHCEVSGYVREASFSVHEGEIVGLYGLIGAGRSELAEGLFGIRPLKGELRWRGKRVRVGSPRRAVELGMALVPEDRKLQGLVLEHSVKANVLYPNLRSLSKVGILSHRRADALYKRFAERLALKTSSPAIPVGQLSGGNQQKVVLAKWLSTEPKLLILDEPTRGIDVGAKAEVHGIIRELAGRGIAVILISSEMEEIIHLSHRVFTMRDGRIEEEITGDRIKEEEILRSIMAA